MKLAIGLTGRICAGKEAFGLALREALREEGFAPAWISTSRILSENLALLAAEFGLDPRSRKNLQNFGAFLEDCRPGALPEAARRRAVASGADVAIIESIRWPADLAMLRSFPANFLVYVKAPFPLRYERAAARREKTEEAGLTESQFRAMDSRKTELVVPRIGREADWTCDNRSGLAELERNARAFVRERVKPALAAP